MKCNSSFKLKIYRKRNSPISPLTKRKNPSSIPPFVKGENKKGDLNTPSFASSPVVRNALSIGENSRIEGVSFKSAILLMYNVFKEIKLLL